MTEQEAALTISNLLESARSSIDAAMSLGREHGIPVDLNKIGGAISADDMWYVDEEEFRREYIAENYFDRDEFTYQPIERELTTEELKEVDEHIQAIRDEGGYDGDYKVLGWMSSSTNC